MVAAFSKFLSVSEAGLKDVERLDAEIERRTRCWVGGLSLPIRMDAKGPLVLRCGGSVCGLVLVLVLLVLLLLVTVRSGRLLCGSLMLLRLLLLWIRRLARILLAVLGQRRKVTVDVGAAVAR